VFASTERQGSNGLASLGFFKADRRVTCFYFYVWDVDFGPAFIKVCAYFPYRSRFGSTDTSGPNAKPPMPGSGSPRYPTGSPPVRTRSACRRSATGSEQAPIKVFFQRWMSILPLPLPLTDHDRSAGYWWELSMRQIEVSRTIVFDAPRHARAFFEALVVDNLDIGRPDSVELIFTGPRRTGRRPTLGCVPKNQGRHPRHRRHRERLLQALPDQAVPQGRPRPAGRDRGQLTHRTTLPASPDPSR